jgi:uncharacterized protein (TIGR03435 family)
MRLSAFFLLLATAALAQPSAPPSFEVASVKINRDFRQDDRSTWSPSIKISPGSVTMRNVNLVLPLAWANRVQRPQISGPAWFDAERYDILAKTGQPVPEDEMRPMLAALLAERFRMAMHRETRQMDAMALVEPKGGHKMKLSDPDTPAGSTPLPGGGMAVKGVSLEVFAEEMTHDLRMPIVDMTGLKGRFEFTLDPQKYVQALRSQVMTDPQHAPTEAELRVTLMQQVIAGATGLRLEPRRAAVEVLVIDRAEKVPVEN